MAKLDNYQLAEFENHYSSSYVAVDDRLAYVHSKARDPREAYIAVYKSDFSHEEMNVDIERIEHAKVPAGFYTSDNGMQLLCFTRNPITQIKKGLNTRNSTFFLTTLENGDISLRTSGFTNARIVSAFYESRVEKTHNIKKTLSSMASSTTTITGVAIGRDYGLLRYVSPVDSSRAVVIVGLGGPIGRMSTSKEPAAFLYEPVSYMADSFQEQFVKKYGHEIKIEHV